MSDNIVRDEGSVNRAELLARYDRLRSTIELYGMRRAVTPYGVRHIDPDGASMILFTDNRRHDGRIKIAQYQHDQEKNHVSNI